MKYQVKPVNPVKAVSVVKPTLKNLNVQDRFLKEFLNKVITVRTVEGEEVTGCLKCFDKYVIRLDYTDRLKSLIYKSAISRVDVEL